MKPDRPFNKSKKPARKYNRKAKKKKDKPDTKKKDKPDIEKHRSESLTFRNDLQI